MLEPRADARLESETIVEVSATLHVGILIC